MLPLPNLFPLASPDTAVVAEEQGEFAGFERKDRALNLPRESPIGVPRCDPERGRMHPEVDSHGLAEHCAVTCLGPLRIRNSHAVLSLCCEHPHDLVGFPQLFDLACAARGPFPLRSSVYEKLQPSWLDARLNESLDEGPQVSFLIFVGAWQYDWFGRRGIDFKGRSYRFLLAFWHWVVSFVAVSSEGPAVMYIEPLGSCALRMQWER